MTCMCSQGLAAAAQSLKNLPQAMLASLVNDQLGPLNQAVRLAPQLCASLSAIASSQANVAASASATAAASAAVSLSASAMARLEALASVNRSLRLGSLTPSVAARMKIAINSVNLQAPSVMAALNELLEPIAAAIDKLQALAASLQGIQSLTGINLAKPGIAFPQLSFSATAAVQAKATAQASASAVATARASATLSANALMAMRLQAAAMALGFPLPSQAASLNASMSLAAGLPAMSPASSLLPSICNKLSALAATALALGVNLLNPLAAPQLLSALHVTQANLQAMATANLNAMVTSQASVATAAAVQAAASLNVNAILSAAENLNLSIPDLQPLATSMSLAANLRLLTGTNVFASRPCTSCRMF